MKKMNAKDILFPTLALFLICLIATVLLAATDQATAEKIYDNEVQTAISSRKDVLAAVDGVEVVEYTENATEPQTGLVYNEGKGADGATIGYIFTNSAKGYGGDVKIMVGYDLTGTIVGFKVISASDETPGLGQNSTKETFWARFLGKSGTLEVNKQSNDGQNLQAITSATITSTAVVKAVNEATAAFTALTGVEPQVAEKGGDSNG